MTGPEKQVTSPIAFARRRLTTTRPLGLGVKDPALGVEGPSERWPHRCAPESHTGVVVDVGPCGTGIGRVVFFSQFMEDLGCDAVLGDLDG